ncbi:hypothetical protein OEZ85_008624 [Tetradesmus obliquus]|uniref:Uncharacterized protein n=1 Tax=Tetradesmus obliquus TaxID=3088 RepID=A0ABY8TJW7_TETOB|nr:hypothetical protein OEZ85_008624 [Tetradesmus obliquus]
MAGTCCASKLRVGSGVLLALCVASWVIALGGLGSINWLVCSDYEKTMQDIQDNSNKNFNMSNTAEREAYSYTMSSQLNIPEPGSPAAKDIAVCARSWRWEWFAMFFQFVIAASALVVTMCPKRLLRARFPLSIMLAIATAIIMIAVNNNIADVWFFWDSHKMFADWTGVLSKLYMSSAALVTGWILVIFFNLCWIGFTLDCEDGASKECAAAPITGDVESADTKK